MIGCNACIEALPTPVGDDDEHIMCAKSGDFGLLKSARLILLASWLNNQIWGQTVKFIGTFYYTMGRSQNPFMELGVNNYNHLQIYNQLDYICCSITSKTGRHKHSAVP